MAILFSDSNVPINLECVSPQTHSVLSAKLCIEPISMKKNKSLTERFNKIGPSLPSTGNNFVMVAKSIIHLYTLFPNLKIRIN